MPGPRFVKGSYVAVRDGEVAIQCPYPPVFTWHRLSDPRTRNLRPGEIEKLGKPRHSGMTLVSRGLMKPRVKRNGSKGKKLYDKRETEMRRTVERETRAQLKERQR